MGAALPNVIASTKLTIPSLRRALVPRPDLSARLDEADYRFALVAAPAGYGKTATLASWASQQPHDLAWLSCDSSDAEPSRFMSGLLASISGTWPGVADDAFVLLEREGQQTYDAAVAVANELASVQTPGVIVVDDLHLAKPAPELLSRFLEATPDHFRLVFGSRTDLPISMARLRMHGGLLELRSDELRFSAPHMAEFSQLHGLSLDPAELATLHDLTEGWPAGALLAVLALRRATDRAQFFEAFARTDRAVGDFLMSEVLDNLPADLVDFLVDTSVLDAFDAELCALVSGRDDAALLLDRLIATDLFVVALDDAGRWNRYHHLFGAFLRARLTTLGDARRRAVHDRASRALEARRDVIGALQHAMAGDDVERVGQVLRDSINREMSVSDAVVTRLAIRSWLHEFGAQLVDTNPAWVVEVLVALIGIAGGEDAIGWIERIEQAHPNRDGELMARTEAARGEFHVHKGESQLAIEHAQLALSSIDGRPPNKGLLPLIPVGLARAYLQAGDTDGARATITRAAAWSSGNAIADGVRYPALSALLAAADGDLGRATEIAADVERRADDLGLGLQEPGRIWAAMTRVEAHLERNELDNAYAVFDSVRAGAEASHRPPFQSLATLQHARLARSVGDADAADALLTQATLLLSNPDAAARSRFGVEAVEQALRFDPATAAKLIDALDHDRLETRILRVRQLVIERNHRAAAELLDSLPPPLVRRLCVERDVLRALTCLEADPERANDHLRAALVASRPERLIRSIIDPGPSVDRLLRACTPDADLQSYLDELIAATSRTVAPRRAEIASTLVEPLTPREMTVLRYLSSRLTYAEIAAALYVSVNTLKSHVKGVYRKLGVISRSDAVSVGRSLQLI